MRFRSNPSARRSVVRSMFLTAVLGALLAGNDPVSDAHADTVELGDRTVHGKIIKRSAQALHFRPGCKQDGASEKYPWTTVRSTMTDAHCNPPSVFDVFFAGVKTKCKLRAYVAVTMADGKMVYADQVERCGDGKVFLDVGILGKLYKGPESALRSIEARTVCRDLAYQAMTGVVVKDMTPVLGDGARCG